MKLNSDISPLNYYEPKHFSIEEFVDIATFLRKGPKSLMNMDTRMLITMDKIREYFNQPITINNWKWKGKRQWSGLRTKDSSYFNYDSQHTFGRAIDFLVKNVQPQDVRNEIKSNPNHEAFEFITAIEDFPNMNWTHIDCRNWNKIKYGILIFAK